MEDETFIFQTLTVMYVWPNPINAGPDAARVKKVEIRADTRRISSPARSADSLLGATSSSMFEMFGENDSHLSQPSVRNGNDTSPTLQPPSRTGTGSITMTHQEELDGQRSSMFIGENFLSCGDAVDDMLSSADIRSGHPVFDDDMPQSPRHV